MLTAFLSAVRSASRQKSTTSKLKHERRIDMANENVKIVEDLGPHVTATHCWGEDQYARCPHLYDPLDEGRSACLHRNFRVAHCEYRPLERDADGVPLRCPECIEAGDRCPQAEPGETREAQTTLPYDPKGRRIDITGGEDPADYVASLHGALAPRAVMSLLSASGGLDEVEEYIALQVKYAVERMLGDPCFADAIAEAREWLEATS